MRNVTTMKSRFKSYCNLCLYTIWAGELIKFDGSARHLDCEEAVKDKRRRMKEMNQTQWEKNSSSLDRSVLANKILSRNQRRSLDTGSPGSV